jgi:hypothetical protein
MPVAMTAFPAARAALAIGTPIARLVPVIHRTLLMIGFLLFLLEEKSCLPAQAEKHVLCLMVIIDAPSHRMVEELAQMIV